VISTLFWTILWGPLGLLLATPLTACLVVLGRHIEALRFIDILLGDEPALEPHQRFYQRVLACDATEVADQAEQQLKSQPLSAYYDTVAMPALMLAQSDAALGRLSREKQEEIRDTIEEVVEELADYSDEVPDGHEADAATATNPRLPVLSRAQLPDDWQMPYPVLCVPGRSPLDEAACTMLAHVLGKHGISAWVQPFADVASTRSLKIAAADAPLVCLSYFGAVAKPAHVRYLIRRLKRAMPRARFMVGFWMLQDDPDKVEDWRRIVGADIATSSLAQTVEAVVGVVGETGPRANVARAAPVVEAAA
jgi:hypothetical protein